MKTNNLNKIYESISSTIYKGKHSDFDNTVIIKTLNAEYPTEEQITCFNNEYEFTKKVEIFGVRKVLKKDKADGKNILIMECFEGETLKNYIKETNPDIKCLLRIACEISQIIGKIHQHNIIHKDINSNNILINKNSEIRIIDFGLATKYSLKTQNLSNPEHLGGTLQYISPEQTGRMNRSVDYRTDLYSFGIVLYEIFTMKLPFREKDSMELIHSHIAKSPIPPNEINEDIPKVLSDIILKLLSKNAEARYQSAFGLRHDLERITNVAHADQLQTTNFQLGEKDFSGRLSIPEKLYGREKEIEKLYHIFENVNYGQTELLLISGLPGVGKTVLIHEIHKQVTAKKGFYIEGKFDKFKQNIPYSAIVQAFTNFTNIILKETDTNLHYWKILIQKAVGNVGGVLTNLIPELELIIGKQDELPEFEGKESLNRFNYVWRSFVKAVSQAKHPLVIFIDDLQWADNASVELLKIILSDLDIKYLFCIIAYRDNEIDNNVLHELTNLEEINISNIKLENLKQTDVNNLVKDTLNVKKTDYSKGFSELIFSKTSGNAFFTVQFLKNLYESKLLKFEFAENNWKFDFAEIKKQNITDNVVELMANKVEKLPKDTQEILKIAACTGNSFDLKTLSKIYKKDEISSKNDLEPAIIENLVIPVLDNQKYKFVHDRIQQAVYSTIPNDEKNNFHLQTGKLLLEFLDEKDLENQIFEVVNQLNYGIDLIQAKEEKQKILKLNIQAGQKAKLSSAYLTAREYFKISKSILEKKTWEIDYKFTLKIYNELVELSYLTGNYKDVETYGNIIIANTKNDLDKVNAYYSLINTYKAQALYKKAIKTGLEIISKLGISFPKKASQLDVIINYIKVSISLKRLGTNRFKSLPEMSDERIKAQIKLFNAVTSSLFYTDKNLLPIFVFRAVRLMIKFGFSKDCPYFISAYGFILGMFNKIEQANKLGKIAIEIQDKYNYSQAKCRTIFLNLAFINVWKVQINKLKKYSFENYKIGLQFGDLEYATFSLSYFSYYSLYSDANLQEIKKISTEHLKQIKKLNQKDVLRVFLIYMQTICNLVNENYNTVSSTPGDYFNESKEIPFLVNQDDTNSLSWFYSKKIFLIYMFNNTNEMKSIIEKVLYYKEMLRGTYYFALMNFFHSLCLLATIDKQKQKAKILKTVSKNQKQMKIWANHCPENYQHKYDLVEAEKFRILGKNEIAQDFYNKAIKGANKNRFLSEEAISWEAGGRFYIQEKNEILAKTYFQNAYKAYKIWGATAKLRQLEDKYPQFIFEKQNTVQSPTTSNLASSSSVSKYKASSLLDLTTIVKASQSLSGEVKLEKLLKSMLMLIMENAGADYAVIIQNDEEKYTIEAKGKHGSDNIEVFQSENLEKSDAVALNIVKYVIRTRKFVVIDNALEDKNYSENKYIQERKVKSVLCFPVIHKNNLTAILYLENNLGTHVFTPTRIETINILSSQIAISLENALLYRTLEERVNTRTKELKKSEKNLKELNATKDKFFSIIAHDLKSPFSSMLGFSNILMENFDTYDTAKQKKFLGYINDGIEKTYKLLENLLIWSRSQKGSIDFKPENLNLYSIVNETIELFHQQAENKLIRLRNKIPENFHVEADRDMLSTITRNLISNAIKFTPKGGEILIEALNRQQYTEIAIKDSGVGIAKKIQAELFDISKNTSTEGTENEGGTGLGLILCKEFVEKHGGEIWVESEKGKGAVFYFTLQVTLK